MYTLFTPTEQYELNNEINISLTQYNVITIYIGLLKCTGQLFTHIVHFKHNIYRSLKVQVHRSLTLYYVDTIHTGLLKCTVKQFTRSAPYTL